MVECDIQGDVPWTVDFTDAVALSSLAATNSASTPDGAAITIMQFDNENLTSVTTDGAHMTINYQPVTIVGS